MIKTVCDCHKTEIWIMAVKRSEYIYMHIHIYIIYSWVHCQIIFHEVPGTYNVEWTISPTNDFGKLRIYIKQWSWNLTLYCKEKQTENDEGLKVENLRKKTKREGFETLGLETIFCYDIKSNKRKNRPTMWYQIIKFTVHETINKMEKPPTEWEKTLVNSQS